MQTRSHRITAGHRRLAICGLWFIGGVYGQDFPRAPWGGYPFPAAYDAEIADPDVHRVLFEDASIMFLEVSNPPELNVKMHGHPYPSVFARDTGASQTTSGVVLDDTHLDPKSPFAGQGWGQGPAPAGMAFPRCTTAPPEGPHRPINHSSAPVHFYRLEFRRLDGADLRSHWKEWYPWLLAPLKAVPSAPPRRASSLDSAKPWPYSPLYDSVLAAPNNYQLLYEDSHVRLLEVAVRPGETTPMHGHPYASVLAFNTVIDSRQVSEVKLDPSSPLNGQGSGQGPAPGVFDLTSPTCTTMAPQAPHAIRNKGDAPLHYYRIEFKRVDGDAFQAHWQEWYPWMKYMKNMR